MKVKVFILLTALFLAVSGFARQTENLDNLDNLFHAANKLYEQGKYDEAVSKYKKILDEGFESGNLYYNLGSCYLKKGERGRAVLNYERAKRLIPRDRDLKSNYKYAKSLIEGAIPEAEKIWIKRVISGGFDRLTVDGIALVLSVVYMFLILLASASAVFRISRPKLISAIAVLALFFSVGVGVLAERTSFLGREAVVINEKIEANFEPFDKAAVHFSLYEGSKVLIISSKGGWVKVKRADKKAGWVKNSVLERI